MIRRGGGGDLLVISISPLTSSPGKPLKQGAKSKGIEPEGEGWDQGIWGTAVRVRPRKLILGTS